MAQAFYFHEQARRRRLPARGSAVQSVSSSLFKLANEFPARADDPEHHHTNDGAAVWRAGLQVQVET